MLQYVIDNMRQVDVIEVMASNGFTPEQAVHESVKMSHFNSIMLINDDVCAVYGLYIIDALCGVGVPWLLGTDHIAKHKREFMAATKDIIEDMHTHCDQLFNYVHADNLVSIRWLNWLGFTFDEPIPMGINGEKFMKFNRSLKDV